jgi:hypothetical protein
MVNGELQDWTGSRYHLSYIFLPQYLCKKYTHINAYTLVVLHWSVLLLTVVNQIQMNSLTEIYPEEL